VKEHYYSQHAGALRAELGAAISREEMRELHRKQPLRHFAVAIRQFAVLGIATWALIRFDHPLIWIPIALIQGFTVFNFTILLHEVVHHTIFERRHAGVERLLGFLYAIPSGISASQFTRWHLDHHAELGSDEDDPKRRHLSPKVNARWYKLLYCTPALFPIYFRAARRESSSYPEQVQRAIARERKLSMLFHLSALALIWYGFGFYAALRASIIPVFFNSNYHLEHHYFPGVPFYRLPEVQRALVPFYTRKNMRWRTYGELVYGWLVENQAPHTNWDGERIPNPSSLIPNP
jgi:fatty acid desaturase